MLIAHWLYLAAAEFSMLIPGSEEEVGGETFGKDMMAKSFSRGPSSLVDKVDENMMEEREEEEQLDGVGHVHFKPQDTIRKRSKRRTTMLAFTTPMAEIDGYEEEGTAFPGMASRGTVVGIAPRGGRKSMTLGRDSLTAQRLVLSLAAE